MKKWILIGIITLSLICTSIFTNSSTIPYSKFTEIQINDIAFKIKYETNVNIDFEDVQDSLTYYACKITLENGEKYFRRHSNSTSGETRAKFFKKNERDLKGQLTISFTDQEPCNNDLIYDAAKCKKSFE